MGKISEAIRTVADGMGSARAIHEHATYFGKQIPVGAERKMVALSAHGPAQTTVNVDTLFTGEAALPVKITSDGEYVRTITPVKGIWMTILTFSKPGDYDVTFTSGIETDTVKISVSTGPVKTKCMECQ